MEQGEVEMFREAKTLEAAVYFLEKSNNEMPYIKLIKLLYLADRRKMQKDGRTISGDRHYSLKCGPILSTALNAIKSREPDWSGNLGVDLDAKIVWIEQAVRPASLSRSDLEVLEWVDETFGHMGWKELVKYTHTLDEWTPPKGQAKRHRISLEDMARAVGHSDERIERILAEEREKSEMYPVMEAFQTRVSA